MNEDEMKERESCISNFLSIMPEYVKAVSVSNSQCDIKIKRKDGTSFRYGYFQDWGFFRENPVCRSLREHGFPISEQDVGFMSEPQYDMFIEFRSRHGDVVYLSDKRTAYEVDYNYAKFQDLSWRIHQLFGFRRLENDDEILKAFGALLNVFDKVKELAEKDRK